ncbi:MAG: uracil-DNA glycosylase [Acidimicrobiales bacterium]|jgi:uracil-DNA glycosylase family 4
MPADPDRERSFELAALGERISSCVACPRLVAWRNEASLSAPRAFASDEYWARPLPGFGDPEARLVVIGLAPAAHGGNRTGRMFTGDRSGDFLVASLHRHGFANQPTSVERHDGLELTGAYVTAPVRCAPPANRPLPEERDRCLPFLEEELGLLTHATVYLALGAYAFDAIRRVEGVRGRMKGRFSHGAEIALGGPAGARPQTVLCTYHPSQRNVFTGLLTAEMFSDVLARARELVGPSP